MKWLYKSQNQGNNLFDAICNDSIYTWMQMTNYLVYSKVHTFGSGPSKGKLKLRATKQSGDPKKMAKVLNN